MLELPFPAPVTPDDDDLLSKMQLRVAQRADEIARGRATRTSLNLDCWLIAEAEFFREALAISPNRLRN